MIGCRSCQCWCVGCQNRWWSTEEDSSLEFKTSKVWTNNDTLNVSPHPASRVLVSFICLILAHSSLLSMCCLLLARCWGTVSYPGIIAVFLLHRARLCPLVYRLRAVSFFLVRRAKRARHACDWGCVTGEFLASRGFAARCSRKRALGLPLQKERLHAVWSVINKQFPALGKTSWTTEKKIRQMLDAIQAKCLFLLLTLEDKRWLCLQNDHSSVTNEKAIKSCAVVFHPFSQWSQIGP